MGDDDLAGIDHHAGVAHADRHLTTQRLVAGTEHVAERPWALEARDLGKLLVQSPDRQIIHMRHGGTQRNQPFATGLAEHLVDDAAARDQRGSLDPRDIGCRRGEDRRLVDIEAGLRTRPDHALILQVGVGLQHRRVTDAQLPAHLAHRRYTFARPIHSPPDVLGELLGNALIEQQIGHLAGLPPTEP